MIRVIFLLVSAWVWLVAISSMQWRPYALGYQQKHERKDYELQRTVAVISAAATVTVQGRWASSFPLKTRYSSMTWPFTLRFVMHLTGWKSYPEPLNPPVLPRIIYFVEKFLEGISMKIQVNLFFKAVRIWKYVFIHWDALKKVQGLASENKIGLIYTVIQ